MCYLQCDYFANYTSVTGGDFSCNLQLEMPLRRKLQEIIASCNSALWNEDSVVITSDSVVNSKINLKRISDQIQ